MTESTITRTAPAQASDPARTTDEPAEQKLVFHEPGSSYRHALVTGGAFLLSLVINLALLAFIGYLDTGRQEQNSAAEQPVQTTVQLQTIKEVEARKETGSQDNNKKKPTDEAMPKKKPPAPEPVTNPQPLNLNQISNNFDLSTPEFRVQNLAPTRSSTSTSTSESSSNGSSSKEQGNAFHRGELDQLPRKVSGPDPSFPLEARQNRTEGWVMLELDISRNGTVTSVSVLDWKGVPAFKQSALEAVRQWSFKPGKVNGTPVDAKNLRQRIRFQLLD